MSRWSARWRVALRIAWRDAGRNRARTALVVAMVALPLLAGTVLMTVMRSTNVGPEAALGPSAQALVSGTDCAPLMQVPDLTGSGCSDEMDPTPLDPAGVAEVFGDAPAAPLHLSTASLHGEDAASGEQQIAEVDDPATLPAITALVEGELPAATGEIAIGVAEAQKLGLSPGDTMLLRHADEELTVTLVGTLGRGGPQGAYALTGTLPSSWAVVPTTWTGHGTWVILGDQGVTWDQVLAANERGWQVLSRAVLANPPPASEIPYGAPTAAQSSGESIALLGAVLAMGLLEIALLIGPAFAIGARRDARMLALLAASGAQPGDLRRTVLAKGVVAGAVAAVAAVATGLLLAAVLLRFTTAFGPVPGAVGLVVPLGELAAIVALALLLGLGAAWFPARTAAKADVMSALAGRRRVAPTTRGVPRLGLALMVLGALGMLLAAVTQQPAGLVLGVIVLQVGVVMVSGGVVALVSRLAPRLGVSGRFAMRDAVRHRSRTAPAVAAVCIAVAAAAAGTIYATAESRSSEATWNRLTESPAMVLALTPEHTELTAELIAAREDATLTALATIEDRIEPTAAVPVFGAALTDEVDGFDAMNPQIWTEPDPERVCPHDEPWLHTEDPRCEAGGRISSGTSWYSVVLIDDGPLVAALGFDGWEQARDTLQAGGVVVPSAAEVWPDGTAHLINDSDGGLNGEVDLQLPAFAGEWGRASISLILSPAAADQLGLTPVAVGALVTTPEWLTQAEVSRLSAQVRAVAPSVAHLTLDRAPVDTFATAWVLAGFAALVALAAVALTVGLAAADTRPDMATLMAVGAPPRIRRRVAATQAGLIVAIGAILGAVTGSIIGIVLGIWTREQSGYGDLWPLTVPWQVPLTAVLVPLIAMGGAWLFTRSRLPLVRRLAE